MLGYLYINYSAEKGWYSSAVAEGDGGYIVPAKWVEKIVKILNEKRKT